MTIDATKENLELVELILNERLDYLQLLREINRTDMFEKIVLVIDDSEKLTVKENEMVARILRSGRATNIKCLLSTIPPHIRENLPLRVMDGEKQESIFLSSNE